MLDRIDNLMSAMRSVTRNIAHDLRTPLSRLRNRLESAHPAGADETELAGAIRDVDGIIATFNALLSIARIESRIPRQQFTTVSVDHVLQDVADLYRPLAEEEGLTMELATEADLFVEGDSHLLFQAIANLVDNAIKHTPSGGSIQLGASSRTDGIHVTVADSGPGIPASQRKAVLQPFTRLDESRRYPGIGLGLSMVAAIVDLHDARLELADNRPGLRAALIFTKADQPNRPVI
jgi:signal transduction histidine kinase